MAATPTTEGPREAGPREADPQGETHRWVLLLRGINVGGTGKMPMAELRACLTDAGFGGVQTYIQSGNVVLDAGARLDRGTLDGGAVAALAGDAIGAAFGMTPQITVLSASDLARAITANPFTAAAEADPRAVHYFFGGAAPSGETAAALAALAIPGEQVESVGAVTYLLAPAGIGRSKLAAALSQHLGAGVTARNHRSVCAIADLARASGGGAGG